MATNNPSGSHGDDRSRGGRNNNPEVDNQYNGVTSTVRNNPLATAAAVGGAVAAGVFLWSRRNQISDQIGNLANQISDSRGGRRSQTEISEEALTLKETGKAS